MKVGNQIKFEAISDLTGQKLQLEGTIIGGAKEIKKMQPEEYDGMPDDEKVFLVERKDDFGNVLRYVVYPEEILKEVKNENQS